MDPYGTTATFTVDTPGEYRLKFDWNDASFGATPAQFYSSPDVNLSITENDIACEVMQITWDISQGIFPGGTWDNVAENDITRK